jgi:hypothetical protein
MAFILHSQRSGLRRLTRMVWKDVNLEAAGSERTNERAVLSPSRLCQASDGVAAQLDCFRRSEIAQDLRSKLTCAFIQIARIGLRVPDGVRGGRIIAT